LIAEKLATIFVFEFIDIESEELEPDTSPLQDEN
jgi:hypothetical protein